MPLAPVPVPAYPAVPQAPGVPPMLGFFQALDKVTILSADAALLAQSFAGPSWGIFNPSGVPLIIGDSVIAVDYRQEYRVSDYQVENGAFASYDKITVPFDIRVTFASSGKGTLISNLATGGALGAIFTGVDSAEAGRADFLTSVDQFAKSLELVQVITPEASYNNCNITHYDYRRESRNGATLIVVDVWLVEIRTTATATFTQTKMPSGANPISGGNVQPAIPTTSQLTAVAAGAS